MDSRLEERLQLKRDFSDFLDADNGAGPYVSAINDMAQAAEQKGAALRLLVDMNDLLDHDPALHKKLLHRPAVCLPPFQEALEELLRWAAPHDPCLKSWSRPCLSMLRSASSFLRCVHATIN